MAQDNRPASRLRRRLAWLLTLLLTLLAAQPALAHKPSDSYLSLRVGDAAIDGQWDIALRDLDYAIGLDDDQDGAITWRELRGHHADIASYALAQARLVRRRPVVSDAVVEHLVDEHSDGSYAVLRFVATCPGPASVLTAGYRLFFDIDPQHRGLLRLEHGNETRTAIFSADRPCNALKSPKPTPYAS
jgi:hypothetical protein